MMKIVENRMSYSIYIGWILTESHSIVLKIDNRKSFIPAFGTKVLPQQNTHIEAMQSIAQSQWVRIVCMNGANGWNNNYIDDNNV